MQAAAQRRTGGCSLNLPAAATKWSRLVYNTTMDISNEDIATAKKDWLEGEDTPGADMLHRYYASLISGQARQIAADFRAVRSPATPADS